MSEEKRKMVRELEDMVVGAERMKDELDDLILLLVELKERIDWV